MLEDNPLEQLPTQSQPAWGQPTYGVSQMVVHLLMNITQLGRGSAGSCRGGSLCGQVPEHADPKGLGSGSSPGPWKLSWYLEFYPAHFGMASACPGGGQGCSASFYLPKRLSALPTKVVMASRAP